MCATKIAPARSAVRTAARRREIKRLVQQQAKENARRVLFSQHGKKKKNVLPACVEMCRGCEPIVEMNAAEAIS